MGEYNPDTEKISNYLDRVKLALKLSLADGRTLHWRLFVYLQEYGTCHYWNVTLSTEKCAHQVRPAKAK